MKNIIITGGASGIGLAITTLFASKGNNVYFIDYNESLGTEVEKDLLEKGNKVTFLQADVSNLEEVKKTFERIPEKIDVLVNNAGITRDNLFPWVNEKDWDDVINTSVKGMYNCTQAVIGKMLRNRSGRIINVASLSGLKGNPGQTNYSAAKGAMIAATKALSQEVAKRKITVNAVAPGFIVSDMTSELDETQLKQLVPANRFGQPEEVANLVSFLASDKAAYITGEVININGGLYA